MRFLSNNQVFQSWLIRAATALVVVFLVVLGGALLVSASAGGEVSLDADQRIVTIFDNGERKSIVTKSSSVGEALRHADIDVDSYDIVEPSIDTKFDETDYTVNVYRARPVLVVDGMTREWVMSPALSAREIAVEAQLAEDIRPEDIISFNDNIEAATNGMNAVVDVKRAVKVNILLYGEMTTLYTQADTVKGLLEGKGIKLASNDTVTVDLNNPIEEDMTFQIWREGVQTLTEEQEIEFPTRTIQDADKDPSYRELQSAGKPGKRTVTYEVTMHDGQEVSRAEIQNVTTEESIEEVVVVGTKPKYMAYTGGGSKSEWLAASNISEDQWGYVDWLVSKESGWNPNAVNRSSGACGLAQALPCSKVPGNPHDPVNSLNWMNGYVGGRYGSWSAAVSHSQANGWY